MPPSIRSSRYVDGAEGIQTEPSMTNDNNLATIKRRTDSALHHSAGKSIPFEASAYSSRSDYDPSLVASTSTKYIRKRRLRPRALDTNTHQPDENSDKNIFRSSPAVHGIRSEASNTFTVNVTANTAQQNDHPHKPTPVAIAFGFILVALCAIGIGLYAYIFWRKRKKHLINKQRMSGVAPMAAAAMSRKHAPNMDRLPQIRTAATADQTSGQKSDDSSDGSSAYEGLDSGSEGDIFAKELKIAAALDREAWENFVQRKTQHEVQMLRQEDKQVHIPSTQTDGVKLYGGEATEGVEALHAESAWQGLELVNSFPYGDELPNSLSNLTPEDLMIHDANPNGSDFLQQGASLDWAKKSASNGSGSPGRQRAGRAGKPSDADDDSDQDLFFSLAPSQSQENGTRNLTQTDENGVNTTTDTEASLFMESRNEIEDDRIDPDTEDMIKEVQRLSLFVQKYEQKKEKRIRRVMEHQHQMQSHSSFDPNQSGVDDFNEAGVGKLSHLHDADGGHETRGFHQSSLLREAQASNAKSGLRSMTFSKFRKEGSDDSDVDELDPPGQTSMRGLAVGGIFLTDASSDSGTDDDIDFFRLGITPFSSQKPGGPSPHHGARVVEATLQSRNEGMLMTDSSERNGDDEDFFRTPNKSGPELNNHWGLSSSDAKATKKQSLSALRFSESIIDNTNSEVPSSVLTPSDAAQLIAATRPTTTMAAKTNNSGGKSSKFANIVSMFEAKQKDAIFPPNESWQFNS